MRPVRLEMSAFGPYANCISIDFTKFDQYGLYLITGETGAGKTTIFDGIIYALYDALSGNEREKNMVRSQYAEETAETYVQLEFTHGDSEYKIRRNPAYMRPKIRGEGYTPQSADAEMYKDNQLLVSGNDKVTDKVKELLGLDETQFSQITMIAQGEFKKMLKSNTATRRKIFGQVFGTGIYNDIQIKLKERAAAAKKEYEEKLSTVTFALDRIHIPEDWQDQEEYEQLKDGGFRGKIERAIEIVQQLSKADSKEYSNKKLAKKKLEDEKVENDRLIDKVRTNEENLKKVAKLKPEIEERNSQLKKANELLEDTEGNRKQAQQLSAEIQLLSGRIEKTEKLEGEKKNLHDLNNLFESEKKGLGEHRQALERNSEELGGIQETIEDLSGAEAVCKEAENLYTNLNESLKDIKGDRGELEASDRDIEKMTKEYQKIAIEYQQFNGLFAAKEKLYFDNMAGILAEKLETGMPCPVCGSVEHPQCAAIAEGAPDKDEYESLGKKKEKLSAKNERAATGLEKLREKREQDAGKLHKKLEKLVERYCEDGSVEDGEALLEARLKELNKEMVSADKRLQDLKKAEKRRKQLEGEKETLADKVTGAEKKMVSLEEQIKSLEKQIDQLQQETEDKTAQALKAERQALENRQQQLVSARDNAEKKVNMLLNEISSMEGKLKTLEEQIIENPQSMETLMERDRELAQKIYTLDKDGESIYVRLHSNNENLEIASKEVQPIKKAEKENEELSNLCDTMTGDLTGKFKVSLETYVQQAYFDRIVDSANVRLRKMSSGQYELVRKLPDKKNAPAGLDLDVIDYHSGTCRSANSLSGGEMFEASMSLALGMSDVIRAYAGGIHMDALFIDEGFGTLDEDVLSKSMDVLSDLAGENRLVGVISHVPELRDAIPCRIDVNRSHNSSDRKIEIVTP